MQKAQIEKIIRMYRSELESSRGYYAERSDTALNGAASSRALKHTSWMLVQIEGFLKDGKHEKVMRWLGFTQGCLWVHGIYSIDELGDHNRPSQE